MKLRRLMQNWSVGDKPTKGEHCASQQKWRTVGRQHFKRKVRQPLGAIAELSAGNPLATPNPISAFGSKIIYAAPVVRSCMR